jgi:hypothetical protein
MEDKNSKFNSAYSKPPPNYYPSFLPAVRSGYGNTSHGPNTYSFGVPGLLLPPQKVDKFTKFFIFLFFLVLANRIRLSRPNGLHHSLVPAIQKSVQYAPTPPGPRDPNI